MHPQFVIHFIEGLTATFSVGDVKKEPRNIKLNNTQHVKELDFVVYSRKKKYFSVQIIHIKFVELVSRTK